MFPMSQYLGPMAPFLAPAAQFIAPHAWTLAVGVTAGLTFTIANTAQTEPADPISKKLANLGKNISLGLFSGVIATGAAHVYSLIPEGTAAFLAEKGLSLLAQGQAQYLGLPFAAQIAIPVVIINIIFLAVFFNRTAKTQEA